MKTKFETKGLTCLCCNGLDTDRIAYVLYPMDILDSWIEGAVERYKTTIVVISGMDWDNVFSPWPAPGQPPGSPDFKGESSDFLNLLRSEVLPTVEDRLGLDGERLVRTLVGVSMSGLFALWQWFECDTFANIASLSGSFWFPSFIDWVKGREIPRKEGTAYFLLGDKEAKSSVKAFDTVGVNTQEIVALLKSEGINVEFESVPGDHFANPLPRLDRAFGALARAEVL